MADAPSFDQVCSEFRQFRHAIGKVAASPEGAEIREQLEQLGRSMDGNFAELQVVYPKAQTELDRLKAETQQNIQKVKTNSAKVRAEIAKAKAAEATAADAAAAAPDVSKVSKPHAPVDPKLGMELREELLNRCSDVDEADAGPDSRRVKEAWEDWGEPTVSYQR